MTYAETLDFLFTRLPLFSRIGSAAYKKDLTNTIALCGHIGNPQTRFKTIHVGGTNGKGSVSHMLAAVFQSDGYKTGLYTSPHLYDFRERIKINGEMMPEDFVVDFTKNIIPAIDKIEPSFFEITVAMAFDYFAKEEVEIAIIEVGLGGRLDSTNIILPELSVITNVGWDHMNLLGNTILAIAAEKGGIIKEGIPVVIGERSAETDTIFDQLASERRAPICFAGDRFTISRYKLGLRNLAVTINDVQEGLFTDLQLSLTGLYQLKNICTVLQSVEVLRESGWNISDKAIAEGVSQTKSLTGLHGRWEVISESPTVVLEVAHNINGLQQMLQHIEQLEFDQLHLVFGMVNDKEANSILSLLPKDAIYYFSQAQIPRALPAADLSKEAARFDLMGSTHNDVNEALTAAKKEASVNDLIIVCGSIFLVAEVNRNLY